MNHRAPTSSAASSSATFPADPSHLTLRLGTYNLGKGFLRKLPLILTRSAHYSLDFVALQEIGDPAITHATPLANYILIAAPGPSTLEAGVGLLISRDMAPRCRTYLHSSTGRLVGVVLELRRGHRLLLVSAYMPSGLDHRAPTDDLTTLAHQLYSEINQWSLGMQRVIIMGDLNETLTPDDRHPKPARPLPSAAAAAATPINYLQTQGFTDVYRHLHGDAVAQPGYTHALVSASRALASRIDYIWTRGIADTDLLRARVDTKLFDVHKLSHHHLLWADVRLPDVLASTCDSSLAPAAPRHPNLRVITPALETTFCDHLGVAIHHHHDDLQALSSSHDADSISSLAQAITTITRTSSFACLPLTGSRAYHSKPVLKLERQRADLTRLLHTSLALHLLQLPPATSRRHTDARRQDVQLCHSPEWRSLFERCVHTYPQLRWRIDCRHVAYGLPWIEDLRRLITRTRRCISREKHAMRLRVRPAFDCCPYVTTQRMLQSDALPSQLYSVVDAHGELTNTPTELQEVLVQHFQQVFAIPPRDPNPPLPHPLPRMLLHKDGIDPAWYDGLMSDVTPEEMRTVLQSVGRVSAPGADRVSTGVWKISLLGCDTAMTLVCGLFSSCLRTSTFPSAWKSSVILPFIKDTKKERTTSNIRPISLQSCLGKLLTSCSRTAWVAVWPRTQS